MYAHNESKKKVNNKNDDNENTKKQKIVRKGYMMLFLDSIVRRKFIRGKEN